MYAALLRFTLFWRNIHFVAFYALLCGAKINPKISSVEKNDNYHVWMWGNGDTGKLKSMTMLALLVQPQFAKSLCLFRLFPLTGYIGWVGWLVAPPVNYSLGCNLSFAFSKVLTPNVAIHKSLMILWINHTPTLYHSPW